MEIIVDKNEIRIDKYLSEIINESRSLINKMILDEQILVNDVIMKKNSYKVNVGDKININYIEKEIEVKKVPMNLNIVYEDEDIMVINKPSGLVVHPGSGNENNTLVNGLLHYTDKLSDVGGELRAGIVHRLDKDTSGLMLIAKSNEAHNVLVDDLKNNKIKREYIALIEGVFPSQSAKIDAPIGKSKKDFRQQEIKSEGKKAITNLVVIKRFEKYTLIRLLLETGRTHQIRVHLNYIGFPIYNDPVYGNKKATEFGQFLHSVKINFNQPITKKEMFFETDLPFEFTDFIECLD